MAEIIAEELEAMSVPLTINYSKNHKLFYFLVLMELAKLLQLQKSPPKKLKMAKR